MAFVQENKETEKAFKEVKASVKLFQQMLEVMETADKKQFKKVYKQLKNAEVDICNAVIRLEYVLDTKGGLE